MAKRKKKSSSSKAISNKKGSKSGGPEDEGHRQTVLQWLDEVDNNGQKSNIGHAGENSITETQESTDHKAGAFSVPFTDAEELVSILQQSGTVTKQFGAGTLFFKTRLTG